MSGIGVAAVARAAPGERSSTAPGRIRQGADGSEPESAPLAWIAMMFSAGLGIGLVFHGVGEPLRHFLDPPPASGVPVGTGTGRAQRDGVRAGDAGAVRGAAGGPGPGTGPQHAPHGPREVVRTPVGEAVTEPGPPARHHRPRRPVRGRRDGEPPEGEGRTGIPLGRRRLAETGRGGPLLATLTG